MSSFSELAMELHEAIAADDSARVLTLLAQGANVNSRWEDQTPLHISAYSCLTDMTRLLLARGALVNAKTTYSVTPLHWAARHDARETIKILLDHGADRSLIMYNGHTPEQYAQSKETRDMIASYERDPSTIVVKIEKTPSAGSGTGQVDLLATATVGDLISILARTHNVDSSRVRIVFREQLVSDPNSLLRDIGIEHLSVITFQLEETLEQAKARANEMTRQFHVLQQEILAREAHRIQLADQLEFMSAFTSSLIFQLKQCAPPQKSKEISDIEEKFDAAQQEFYKVNDNAPLVIDYSSNSTASSIVINNSATGVTIQQQRQLQVDQQAILSSLASEFGTTTVTTEASVPTSTTTTAAVATSANQVIETPSIIGVKPTSISISFNASPGLVVRWRTSAPWMNILLKAGPWQSVTLDPGATTFTISQLKAATWYDIELESSDGSVRSRSLTLQTLRQ